MMIFSIYQYIYKKYLHFFLIIQEKYVYLHCISTI